MVVLPLKAQVVLTSLVVLLRVLWMVVPLQVLSMVALLLRALVVRTSLVALLPVL